jgi:hypothetical protein
MSLRASAGSSAAAQPVSERRVLQTTKGLTQGGQIRQGSNGGRTRHRRLQQSQPVQVVGRRQHQATRAGH